MVEPQKNTSLNAKLSAAINPIFAAEVDSHLLQNPKDSVAAAIAVQLSDRLNSLFDDNYNVTISVDNSSPSGIILTATEPGIDLAVTHIPRNLSDHVLLDDEGLDDAGSGISSIELFSGDSSFALDEIPLDLDGSGIGSGLDLASLSDVKLDGPGDSGYALDEIELDLNGSDIIDSDLNHVHLSSTGLDEPGDSDLIRFDDDKELLELEKRPARLGPDDKNRSQIIAFTDTEEDDDLPGFEPDNDDDSYEYNEIALDPRDNGKSFWHKFFSGLFRG